MSAGLVDLHRHLDGSLRPATVVELAAREGVEVPDPLAFHPRMGLAEALSRFDFTLKLLQTREHLTRVAAELCEDAAADGVSVLEIRFAPQLHGTRNLSLHDAVDAVLEGSAGRATVILCGLYGEHPGVLRALVDVARGRPGVVGIDLAGGPIPGDRWGIEDYATAFREAAREGLGRTVHAGEGRPPAEIRAAIEVLGATRIGHGTSLLDDPSVTDLVLARDVTLEACVTSNLHTGAVDAIDAHPLPLWLARGVRACVCTDNTLLSQVTTSSELALASKLPGMTEALLAQAIEHGRRGAFVRQN